MEHAKTFVPAVTEEERAELLAAAEFEIKALKGTLGGKGGSASFTQAAKDVDNFRKAIVRYGDFPDVIPFRKASFAEYGWPVPNGFDHLDKHFKFYWVRFPVVLKPAPNSSYSKLEYEVEFGTNISDDHLKPKAHLIFPAKKFSDILKARAEVELGVSGNVAATAPLPAVSLSYFDVKAEAEVNAGATVDVKIGPLDLTLRRTEIDHSAEGAETVYWELANAQFIQEDNPSPIVVLQVPKEVNEVTVLARMQAFHNPELTRNLKQVYEYLTSKIQNFLGGGAPVPAPPKEWPNILAVTG